jgi:hypothetical protein
MTSFPTICQVVDENVAVPQREVVDDDLGVDHTPDGDLGQEGVIG